MTSGDIAARDYSETLQKLNLNNKLMINMLTILAEDYAEHASRIVECIEQSIYEVPRELKLVRLYLVDSIVKNLPLIGNYRELFGNRLDKIYLHVFQRGDERMRADLLRLRNTWTDIFPRGKLYLIDVQTHGNLAPSSTPRSTSTNSTVTTTSAVPTRRTEAAAAMPSPPTIVAAAVTASPSTETTMSAVPTTPNAPTTKSDMTITTTAMMTTPINTPMIPTTPISSAPTSVASVAGTKHAMERPPAAIAPRSEPMEKRRRENSPIKERRPRGGRNNRGGVHHRPPLPPMHKMHIDPSPPLIQPTAALGSHAFALQSAPASAMPPPTPPSSMMPPPSTPFTPLTTRPSTAGAPFTTITPTMLPPIVDPYNGGYPNAPPTPINNNNGMPPPQMHPNGTFLTPSQPQIRSETPRLPNAQSNNRIFVDGKAYEVIFINDIAVIERNGVPHRIFFRGPPRDIIVDGVAHQLAFGETKQIIIDNQPHLVRFGAPSRELYMGDFPFRGVFGSGQPIVATINRRRHEIRLCGPPPEVKIEQDPCYELMRHMESARQQAERTSVPTKKDGETKIGDLLARLQQSGALDSIKAVTSAKKDEPKSNNDSPASHGARGSDRESTPPIIPSTLMATAENEEREVPTTPLSTFYPRDLLVRYTSVIKSLHEERIVCPDCGVRFEDRNTKQYTQHIDEHVKRDINNGPNESRARYLMEDDWLRFSLVETVNRVEPVADAPLAASTDGQDALSSETTQRECDVCHEAFKEYLDADEDEWRLAECVIVDGKALHRQCNAAIANG